MDADLQHPPPLILEMLELHRQGYDQVVARRTRDGEPFGRTLASRLYYRLVNSLVDVSMEDGVGDFRLLSRRAVDTLLQMREYKRFSKGLFAWIGFPMATVDYRNVTRRGAGQSRWSFRRLLNYGIDGIMSFNDAPLRLSIYLGAIVTALSFAYVIFLVVAALVQGIRVPGYITLVAAVLGLGGLQLLFLGVIGEYVGRIYYETKQRPHFVVAETSPGTEAANAVASGRPAVRGVRDGRWKPARRAGRGAEGPHPVIYQHVSRFAVVGVVNTVVYYAVYLVLRGFMHYLAAHVIAIVVAMVGSFFINCYWIFRTRPTWRKFAVFPLTNATNYLLTTVGVVVLVEWLHVDQRVAPLVAAMAAIPVTFLLSRRILAGRRVRQLVPAGADGRPAED